MSGRRYRSKMTPAQIRGIASRHVQRFEASDRPRAAYEFLRRLNTDPEVYYNDEQKRAATEGLELGMA